MTNTPNNPQATPNTPVTDAQQKEAAAALMADLHKSMQKAQEEQAKLPQGMVDDTIKIG